MHYFPWFSLINFVGQLPDIVGYIYLLVLFYFCFLVELKLPDSLLCSMKTNDLQSIHHQQNHPRPLGLRHLRIFLRVRCVRSRYYRCRHRHRHHHHYHYHNHYYYYYYRYHHHHHHHHHHHRNLFVKL